jgi:DNA-binding MarR family transcriptional regulator
VQRLVAAGFAERASSDEDGRVVMVSVTPAGRARFERAAALRSETMNRILSAFDEHERVLLADLLDRFVRQFDELIAEAVERPAD